MSKLICNKIVQASLGANLQPRSETWERETQTRIICKGRGKAIDTTESGSQASVHWAEGRSGLNIPSNTIFDKVAHSDIDPKRMDLCFMVVLPMSPNILLGEDSIVHIGMKTFSLFYQSKFI